MLFDIGFWAADDWADYYYDDEKYSSNSTHPEEFRRKYSGCVFDCSGLSASRNFVEVFLFIHIGIIIA